VVGNLVFSGIGSIKASMFRGLGPFCRATVVSWVCKTWMPGDPRVVWWRWGQTKKGTGHHGGEILQGNQDRKREKKINKQDRVVGEKQG